MNAWEEITPSIIGVGGGRGFVVQGEHDSYVITAGHCLPHMPPCASFSHSDERTQHSLLGAIGAKPTISTEVMFVDPISDLAVLGPPDMQRFSREYDAYREFTEALPAVEIADALPFVGLTAPGPTRQPAWFMTLDMQWVSCTVQHLGGPLTLESPERPVEGGVSGSPIINADGEAIGVVTTGTDGPEPRLTGPEPRLVAHLPGWLLTELL